MAVFDLFSKRQKRLRGEVPDIFVYDKMPEKFRTQVVHIINDAIGHDIVYDHYKAEEIYESIAQTLRREYGVFHLGNIRSQTAKEEVIGHLLRTSSVDEVVDIIELTFKCIDRHIRKNFLEYSQYTNPKLKPSEAIAELNERFKENGIGYSFISSEIIRIDSTYAHSEITKPTINLLSNRKFKGANDEYLKAHEHYRHNRNKECLTDCLKAFESTIKIICKEKGWTYNETDTAKKLIQVCFQNNLVPPFTQNQFTSLQNLLESGIPTIRNKLGGHGQGQVPQEVDDEMTRYGMNLTGTNIIFLIEQSGVK